MVLSLDNFPPGEEVTINFNAMAKTLDGKAITPAIKPVAIDDSLWSPAASGDNHASAPLEDHAGQPGQETAAGGSDEPAEHTTEPAAEPAGTLPLHRLAGSKRNRRRGESVVDRRRFLHFQGHQKSQT